MKKLLFSLILTIISVSVIAQTDPIPNNTLPKPITSYWTINGSDSSLNLYINSKWINVVGRNWLSHNSLQLGSATSTNYGAFFNASNQLFQSSKFLTDNVTYASVLLPWFANAGITTTALHFSAPLSYLAVQKHLGVDGSGNVIQDTTSYIRKNFTDTLYNGFVLDNGGSTINFSGSGIVSTGSFGLTAGTVNAQAAYYVLNNQVGTQLALIGGGFNSLTSIFPYLQITHSPIYPNDGVRIRDVDSLISAGVGASVTSFNSRTGAVTLGSSDITTALGYTPETVANKTATQSSSTTTYPNWLGVSNALVNYQPKTYTPLGTMINENWTSLSNWNTSAGGGFSVASNVLTATNSNSSLGFANYIYNTSYGATNLEDYTVTYNDVVGTISSTSFGNAVGLKTANAFIAQQVEIGLLKDATNGGRIAFYYNFNTTPKLISTSKLALTVGDNLKFKIIVNHNKIIATLTDVTTDQSITEVFPISVSFPNAGYYIPNYGNFAIYNLGGTSSISNFQVYSNEVTSANWMIIHDSIGDGQQGNSSDNRMINILQKMYQGSIIGYGQGGNRFEDNNTTEIGNLNPGTIIVDMGTNNIGNGQSVGTFNSNMTALMNALIAQGKVLGSTLFICTIMPRNDYNVTTYNANIIATYGTAVIDQYNSFVAASGTGLSQLYDSGDGVHPNALGQQKKADIIGQQSGMLEKINYQQETLTQHIDPLKGTVLTGSGGFNGSISTTSNYNAAGCYYDQRTATWYATTTTPSAVSMYNGVTSYQNDNSATTGAFTPFTPMTTDHSGVHVNTTNGFLTIHDGSNLGWYLGTYTGGGFSAIYPYGVAPSNSNFALLANASQTYFNGIGQLLFNVNGTNYVNLVANQMNPTTTNSVSLGTASLLWANIYATTPTYSTTGNLAITQGYAGSYLAPLVSPTFTGTPTAPTASVGANTTQIATMAAIQAAIALTPQIKATSDLTDQTAVGNITTFTVGASNATFDVSGYINVTAIATDIIAGQITYTDENSNVVTTTYSNISTTGNNSFSSGKIRCKSGTAITAKTTLTTGLGTITFDTGARIVQY
jgi:hypothetical protein